MFKGVFPVVPTPLMDDESLDLAGLKRLVEYYIEKGCHGLLVLGSGGEFPYLTFDEKLQIVETAYNATRGRVPLISGCGFYSLRETLEFIKALSGSPVNGLLAALPTYYAPEFDDILKYYREVCKASPWPVLYYHYPQMTGLKLKAEQILMLVEIENLTGTKVSSMCLKEMKLFNKATGYKEFDMFAGVSFLMKETLEIGGKGVICPIASIAPGLVVDCYNAYMNKDWRLAATLQEKISTFFLITNTFSIPANIQKTVFRFLSRLPWPSASIGTAQRHAVTKEALNQIGLGISSKVRSPLHQLNSSERIKLKDFIQKANLG
jgi:dihydrodipicolinate synthase/N-acetylneuraminate lyase